MRPLRTPSVARADGSDPRVVIGAHHPSAVVDHGPSRAQREAAQPRAEGADSHRHAREAGRRREPRSERLRLYSLHACHELAIFIRWKDPTLFAEAIAPYLTNKLDKTFVDRALLDEDLTPDLATRRLARWLIAPWLLATGIAVLNLLSLVWLYFIVADTDVTLLGFGLPSSASLWLLLWRVNLALTLIAVLILVWLWLKRSTMVVMTLASALSGLALLLIWSLYHGSLPLI